MEGAQMAFVGVHIASHFLLYVMVDMFSEEFITAIENWMAID